MAVTVYRGDIAYAENEKTLKTAEASYLVVEDGFVKNIFPQLPEEYGELPVPVREGYRFGGWFTTIDGNEQITKVNLAVTI